MSIINMNPNEQYRTIFRRPQFRNIIPCEVLFYIEVTFWALSD